MIRKFILLIPLSFILSVEASECKEDEYMTNIGKCKKKTVDKSSLFLESITILGSRAAIDVSKYTGSVSVVDSSKNTSEGTLIEKLSDIPGFETGGDSGRSIGQKYTIRGFGYQSEERVIIKQDGVRRSPSLFSNHISTFRTDPTILKRTEVVKGASSILHGSGAIGGVVGMTTKDASDFIKEGREYGGEIESRYESNNSKSLGLSMAVSPKNKPFEILTHLRFVNSGDIKLAGGGIDDVDEKENDSTVRTAFFKLGYDINDEETFKLSFFNYNQDVTTTWQTLYHTTISEDSPVEGVLKQTDIVADYSWQPVKNDWIDLSLKTFFSNASYDRGYQSKSNPSITLKYENKDEHLGASGKNISVFNTNSLAHRLIIGFDYDHRSEDAIYAYKGAPSGFGSMPNDYNDLGIYLQHELTMFEKLTLTFGARYDYYDRKVKAKKKFSGNNLSPHIGIAYEFLDGITFLGSYSQSFRAPTPHETSSEGALNPHYYYVPNTELDPELAKEFEFGFSIEKDDLISENDSLRFKAMYFTGVIDDMIDFVTLDGTPPESNFYGQYQNVEKAKRQGFEISTKYWIGPLTLGASFEHLDLYDDDTKEKITPSADKFRVSTAYTYIPWNLTIAGEVMHWYKPEQNPNFIVSGGTKYYKTNKGFTQANFQALWKVRNTGLRSMDNSLELAAGINNLFDKKYINANDYITTSRVGKGRNYFVNLKFKF